ncbi:GIY-YIG nuclease family protein [Methylobacterium sp. B1]|uniref:GIY-YIG nuclease family protein n=1 Tax=Methylobacterium sp. B1 TaxID=91459 RepID=UPI00034695EB|nr:GIY-YIG nuclease family protein [Methylobacterium sp. B1]
MRFYVYQLIDPRDRLPFYVGKGTGNRAWQHEAEVRCGRRGCNPQKRARIAAILAEGFSVGVDIIERYECESDAYDHEIELIALTPGLLNATAGGEGCPLSHAEAQRRAAARALRAAQRKGAEARHWLKDWLRRADAWAGATIPGHPQGDLLADRFIADVRALLLK